MFTKNKNCYLNVAVGLALGFSLSTAAQASTITNLTEFYESYGSDFNQDQNNIIEGIFGYVDNYLESDGLQNAINDGFIPLTPEIREHGTHWFNPNFINLANMQIDSSLRPPGLNIGTNGELLGVFWAQELYNPPLASAFQSLKENGTLDSLTLNELTHLYANQLTATETLVPDNLDAFSEIGLGWHKHKNVIFENLGNLNPQEVQLRQSLSDESFIAEVLKSLDESENSFGSTSVLTPLEFDTDLGYPPFNRGASGGFHMLHMWIGQKNDAGLFGLSNKNIQTSENAINESQTFEDGSDGHGHGMEGGDNHGEHSQSVPEPSFVATLLGLMLLGFANKFPRKIAKVY